MTPPKTRSGGRKPSTTIKDTYEALNILPLKKVSTPSSTNKTDLSQTKTSTPSTVFARSTELLNEQNAFHPTPSFGAIRKVDSIRPLNTELSFLPNKDTFDDNSAILPNHFSELGITPIQSHENTPHSSKNTTPLPHSSRASSYNSVKDLDPSCIHERVELLLNTNLNDKSNSDLLRLHQLIIKTQGDIDYLQKSNSLKAEQVSIYITQLSQIKRKIDIKRFNKSESQRTSNETASTVIENYVESNKNKLIAEVASCVLSEYTHVSIKCASTKTEIKRNINSIKADLNNIFTEKKKTNDRVDLLSSSVKQIGHQLQDSWLKSNENFQLIWDQVTNVDTAVKSIKTDIHLLVDKVNKIESLTLSQLHASKDNIEDNNKSNNHFSRPVSLNNSLEESYNITHATPSFSPNDYSNVNNNPYSKIPFSKNTNANRNASADAHQVPVNAFNRLNPFNHTPSHAHSGRFENPFMDNHYPNPQNNLASNNIPIYSNLPSSNTNRQERLVQNTVGLARKILDIPLKNSSKADTLKLVSFDAKKLSAYKTDLKHFQINLQTIVHPQTLDLIDSTIFEIEQWENTLNDLQKQYYMHLSSERSLLTKVDLKPFDGSVEGDTIYHFLNVFNNLADVCHGPNEKAQLLFKSYLCDSLKVEVEPFLPHFEKMSAYLLSRFGDPRKIAADKRRKIASLKCPSNPEGQIDYYKNIEALLMHCESLASTPDVNAAEVSAAVHNSEFVDSVVSHLPRNLINTYSRKLESEPQVPHVSGKRCFEILKNVVSSEWRHISRLFNLTQANSSSESHSKTQNKINSANSQPNKNQKPYVKPRFPHPCPFHDRKVGIHSLGVCTYFFKGSNIARLKLCTDNKVCISCLQKECFSSSPNSCTNDVPAILICSECNSDSSKGRTSNILCCPNDTHSRPLFTDMKMALNEYLQVTNFELIGALKEQFSLAIMSANGHGQHTNHVKSSKSSAVNPKVEVPTFDCSSGQKINKSKVVNHNTFDDSLYIFQQVNVQGTDLLIFYDSGATGNLVLGSLAERLNFKVIKQESDLIGCLGNTSLYTQFGSYMAKLGPDDSGSFHQLLFQGISKITSVFPRYDLSKIAQEAESSGMLPESTILPSWVGGQAVSILLGVKYPELMPKLLFSLPSGIGVYKMPFFDKFGSNIAFGGHHHSITETNRLSTSISINTLSIMLSRSMLTDQFIPWPEPDLTISQRKHPLALQLCHEQSSFLSCTPVTGGDLLILSSESLPDQLVVSKIQSDSSFHRCCPHVMKQKLAESQTIFKSKIPLSKIRESLDPAEELVSFRCQSCEDCIECRKSDKIKSSSLKERMEQKLIEKSIHIDYDQQKVFVSLPFTEDPIAFFKEKFKGKSNFGQAFSTYLSVCRKPEDQKMHVRKAFQELEGLGYIQAVDSLPINLQDLILKAPINHIYPWRYVYKESASTPCRLVVDPTSTGMNLICAKGDPSLASMLGIVLDARCSQFVFCADIKKLYNQLTLMPSAYPYSLMLFDKSLDKTVKPKLYLMKVAWYGHISTSSQASTTLKRLGTDHAASHPEGALTLSKSIYVDDCLKGSLNEDEREKTIDQVKEILGNGGLSLKFVVRSGDPPPLSSTLDGCSVSLLGYSYYTEADLLAISANEINFSKKKRGLKPPNLFPTSDRDSIQKLLLSLPNLTRRQCLARASELFDFIGLIEPFKANLKRSLSRLNLLDWDEFINADEYAIWQSYLLNWPAIAALRFPRSCIPPSPMQPFEARLISCSDASATCTGVALYLSVKLSDNSWSCQLLASRSQLSNQPIPKNELQALVLAMELIYATVVSISCKIGDVIVAIDSTIALCWAKNINGRSRVFVQNRVLAINRYTSWIKDRLKPGSEVHLCHVAGDINPADLCTKGEIQPHQMDANSVWVMGFPWMRLDFHKMPVTFYDDLKVSKDEANEIKQESHEIDLSDHMPNSTEISCINVPMTGEFGDYNGYIVSSLQTLPKVSCNVAASVNMDSLHHISNNALPIIDIIHKGWSKSNNIMKGVARFILLTVHKTHISDSCPNKISALLESKCKLCQAFMELRKSKNPLDGSHPIQDNLIPFPNLDQSNYFLNMLIAVENSIVNNYWDRLVSLDCKKRLNNADLEACEEDPVSGVLYYKGRLKTNEGIHVQDLQLLDLKFIDAESITFNCVTVLPDHPIFYAFAVHTHMTADPHCGIEATLKQIHKRFYPFRVRKFLQALLSFCIKCRIVRKKVLEHEMSSHSKYKFTLAPPFAFSMLDLAQPFMVKTRWQSRQTMAVPVLVCVCILTGATALYICEDWSTASLIQALERHSSRYGCPVILWVDSGSQMVKLKEVEYDLRNLKDQVRRENSIELSVAPPKSHSHQGLVERKICHVRDILEKLGKSKPLLSFIGWETLLAKISNIINSLPICRPSARSVQIKELDLITPNRLLLGFNSNRTLVSPMIIDLMPSACLSRAVKLQESFYELLLKRTHLFIPKSKWLKSDVVSIGDIVLFFIDDSSFKARNIVWHYARILNINNSRLTLEYSGKTIERSKRQVVRVCSEEELIFNTESHYKELTNH